MLKINKKIFKIIVYIVLFYLFYCLFNILYFNNIYVSLLIDKNIIDNAPKSINPNKEIYNLISFANSYFEENFRIKLIPTNTTILLFPKNAIIEREIGRPHNEKLIISFRNSDYYVASSQYATSSINLMLPFFDNYETLKWVLIHEICHQFNAIDLKMDSSIMNGSLLTFPCTEYIDGATVTNHKFKLIDNNIKLTLDEKTFEIIRLSKNEYELTNHNLFSYPKDRLMKIITLYEELLPYAREPDRIMHEIGEYYYQIENNYAKAYDYLKRSISVEKSEYYLNHEDNYNKIFIDFCQICFKLNKLDDILFYANKINDTSKYSCDKFRYIALAYFMKKDYKNAIESFNKVLSIDNSITEIWHLLGLSCFELVLKDVWSDPYIEEAKKAFEKNIELSPHDPDPYIYLGMISLGQENEKEAREFFKKASTLNPKILSIEKKDGYATLEIKDVTNSNITINTDFNKINELVDNVTDTKLKNIKKENFIISIKYTDRSNNE